MPQYEPLDSMQRGDVLGARRINSLGSNLAWLQKAFELEHDASGLHQALSVPRLVCNFSGTTVYGDSEGLVSGAAFSSGLLTFNLPRSVFATAASVRVVVTPWHVEGTPLPITHAVFLGADSLPNMAVGIKLWKRTAKDSNHWEFVTSCRISVAVYVDPVHTKFAREFRRLQTGSKLIDTTDGLRALIKGANELRAAMLVEHASSGAHSSKRVPMAAAAVEFDAGVGSYSSVKEWGTSVAPLTTATAGSLKYTGLGSLGPSITSHAVFLASAWGPWFERRTRHRIALMTVHYPSTGIYSARWEFDTPGNSNQWRMTDGDVFIVVHQF